MRKWTSIPAVFILFIAIASINASNHQHWKLTCSDALFAINKSPLGRLMLLIKILLVKSLSRSVLSKKRSRVQHMLRDILNPRGRNTHQRLPISLLLHLLLMTTPTLSAQLRIRGEPTDFLRQREAGVLSLLASPLFEHQEQCLFQL
jgi:hypothetical protein